MFGIQSGEDGLEKQKTLSMIVPFAGRRVDPLDAEFVRFPLRNIGLVKDRLRDFFLSQNPSMLISSGACGADLLALEVAGDLQIERMMILPFSIQVFRKTSVTDRPGDWGLLFDRIVVELEKKEKIINLNYSEGDTNAYENTNLEILNQADRIKRKENDVIALVAWEGQKKESEDATAHFMEEARVRTFQVREIKTI